MKYLHMRDSGRIPIPVFPIVIILMFVRFISWRLSYEMNINRLRFIIVGWIMSSRQASRPKSVKPICQIYLA